MSEQTTYRGETKPRTPRATQCLTLLSPGLGFLYHGKPLAAFIVNACYLLVFGLVTIGLIRWDILPVLPLLVLVVGGLFFAQYLAQNLVRKHTEPYRLRSYNHWLIYSLFFLFTYFIPLGAGINHVLTHEIAFDRVESSLMHPTLDPGDVILVDRQSYTNQPPDRGDVVWAKNPNGVSITPLRVVGVPGDVVQLSGTTLYINNQPTERSDLEHPESLTSEVPVNPEYAETFQLKLEKNQSAIYPIAISPRVISEMETEPLELQPDQFYLLADNRSLVPVTKRSEKMRDSRHFGAVSREQIIGEAQYIPWSSKPNSLTPRPQRIGLRLH